MTIETTLGAKLKEAIENMPPPPPAVKKIYTP